MTDQIPAPDPRRLAALDLAAHLRDPARKQAFVTPMFDVIAPRYDAFTRLFSFGMDRGWKHELIRTVRRDTRGVTRALDLACGTGDLAFAVQRAWPDAQVSGIDAAPGMIVAAQARPAPEGLRSGRRPDFVVGDAMRLDAPDASVDLLTAGYCYRNLPDWQAGLREAARVLRPGGVFASLDFFRPPLAPWRRLFLGYLRVAGDLVGWWWHRTPVVYGYIGPSIAHFTTAAEYSDALSDAGFAIRTERRWLGGGIALHVAVRR